MNLALLQVLNKRNVRFSLVTFNNFEDFADLPKVIISLVMFVDKDIAIILKSNLFQSSSKYFSNPNPIIFIIASII